MFKLYRIKVHQVIADYWRPLSITTHQLHSSQIIYIETIQNGDHTIGILHPLNYVGIYNLDIANKSFRQALRPAVVPAPALVSQKFLGALQK